MQRVVETGALTMLAFVLASAARAKLSSSERGSGGPGGVGGSRAARLTRALACGELIIVASAILVPARVSGFVLAAAFAAFAITHLRRWHSRREDCGCFGEQATGAPAPSGARAILLTAASAALAAALGLAGASSLAGLASERPAAAAVAALAAMVGALCWRLAFTGAALRPSAAGDRLVTSSAMFLERRFSRRTLLRIAVGGSALCVAPIRYLLYPGSALAAIAPGECGGGLCTDGYTGFCCQINHGRNTCPEGTFAGGWWMCTDYTGHRLCAEEGVRYYVDCNALPGHEYPGGCRCAGGSCGERRVGCNVFRYGQCNMHVAGVTAVVCRMVVCENPSRIPALNCSSSLAVDNAVCAHEAGCLERHPARELAGAGGV